MSFLELKEGVGFKGEDQEGAWGEEEGELS